MSEDPAPSARRDGIRGALAELADALVTLVHTRVELATIEFSEQRDRAAARVALLVVAAIGFTVAWLAVCALVVAEFWDTHRLAALGGVVLFHLAIGLIAIWRARVWGRGDGPPFAATLAEFERDREWIAKYVTGRK